MQTQADPAWFEDQPRLQKIIKLLRAKGFEAYLVGGAVRDLILKRDVEVDLDFAVPNNGLRVARKIADTLKGAFYPLDVKRKTGRVVLPAETPDEARDYLDFASYRGANLLEDLEDRDFTINAMAISLMENPQLIDPFQAMEDLEKKQIRMVTTKTFSNDPNRILRAIRQSTELGFTIEEQTRHYLSQAVPEINISSPERQRNELVKMMNTQAPDQAVEAMYQLGVLPHFLPELNIPPHQSQTPSALRQIMAALRAWMEIQRTGFPSVPARLQGAVQEYFDERLAGDVTRRKLMPLAILLHETDEGDSDQPIEESPARKVMQRFRFSNQAANFVATLNRYKKSDFLVNQVGDFSDQAVYYFFRKVSSKASIALTFYILAFQQASQNQAEEQKLIEIVNKLIVAYFEQYDRLVNPSPFLKGRELIDRFGLKPGELVGRLLRFQKEVQAIGKVKNREEAVIFIQTHPEFLAWQQEQENSSAEEAEEKSESDESETP